jgi:hypothetical protein
MNNTTKKAALAPVTSIQLRRDGLHVAVLTSRTAPKPKRKTAKP